MDRAAKFRAAAAEHNQDRSRRGWRYPDDLKELAADYCLERYEDGASYAEVAEELGIAFPTLSRWMNDYVPPMPSPSLRPVRIAASAYQPGTTSLAIVTPCGLRVEGVSWRQAFELVRALS